MKSQQQKDNTASFHFYEAYKVAKYGASLAVQWLIRLCISNAGDMGLIPGWGTKIAHAAAAAAKSLQSSPTLCDPMDGSPPGSPVPGILQARTLEWVAISFSNA